jgi:glucose-6-phosphate 1-epimerase
MLVRDVNELNRKFGISGELSFVEDTNGIVAAEINNIYASAKVSLFGAHILKFTPRGHDPVLWVSPEVNHIAGKTIHGGIPLCFPWFADHPTDKKKQIHGFAQLIDWYVSGTESLPDGRTKISLELVDDDRTKLVWPCSFSASLSVVVGEDLLVEVCIRNTDLNSIVFTDALHSYFNVGSVSDISIFGLDETDYLDKTDCFVRKRQKGEILITGETNRIYLDTESDCVIRDNGLHREIAVKKHGSRTTVVWNPWHSCERIPDMTAESYLTMICIETANTENDKIVLAPGAEHRFSTSISVKKYS